MGLFERVKEEVKRRGLLEMGDHVLVAVSGGPDSMCLLYCLWWLRRDYGLKLTIAHLDHGIRPDTEKDLEAVRWAAEDLGLPLVYERRDVPAFAKERKLNLEEAARMVRRDFLERAAKDAGATKIALGHTRTDLAETVLMHILRGASSRFSFLSLAKAGTSRCSYTRGRPKSSAAHRTASRSFSVSGRIPWSRWAMVSLSP